MEEITTPVLSEQHCHLGEGCTYDPITDTAWWFDILERTLFRANRVFGAVTSYALPAMASVLAFIDDQRQLLAAENGLYIRDVANGRLALHMPLEADKAATRSNDGRVHPCGALWIGTMGREAERGAGAIYRVHRGELLRLYAGISIPNAICFSPDGATAYFTDSSEGILHRVAVNPTNAMPIGDPSTLCDHRGETGSLDGAVVDADGLIWNARWGGSCIDVYTPGGERVRTFECRRRSRVARSSSARISIGCWSRQPGKAWTNMSGLRTRIMAFILDVGAVGRAEPGVKLTREHPIYVRLKA
jgi:sugar lactone lactonase YvrE